MAATAAQTTTWDPPARQEDENYDFKLPAEADYNDAQLATQRMKSASDDDALHEEPPKNESALLPALEPKDDQWIHRDKLAKIESQELQAAGLYVPRSRAPSKQARDRSRSAMRRGTDASETRSRKNSASVEQRAAEYQAPSWDLRTPEEIAEEEASAYFISNSLRGASRIPVAKTSPAPISLDHLERGTLMSESPETAARSRSASASLRNPTLPAAKRSNTDVSPKKAPTSGPGRKMSSSGAKAGQRPKTRNGSGGNNRPPTRSGDSPPSKQPEGDPPWMVNAYKPDPRLPPDQQLLPTVARRLQQEKWEKDGTYGNIYDKEFRPLNDTTHLQPPEPAGGQAPQTDSANTEPATTNGEWPLRPVEKSPSIRQGSYSTMPKISDKPPTSPMPSPRPNANPPMFQPQIEVSSPAAQRPPETKQEPKEGGCGCCVVM